MSVVEVTFILYTVHSCTSIHKHTLSSNYIRKPTEYVHHGDTEKDHDTASDTEMDTDGTRTWTWTWTRTPSMDMDTGIVPEFVFTKSRTSSEFLKNCLALRKILFAKQNGAV
jgi:hypothetical protein